MPQQEQPEARENVLVDVQAEESAEGKIDPGFVERVLSEALRGRTLAGPFEVGVTITTDEGIRRLNRRYRGLDEATDVLSFPLLEFDTPEKPRPLFPTVKGEPVALGDIVISYPRAVEQAEEYGHAIDREVAFLLVHGVMHLLGYDHERDQDRAIMRGEEESVLGRLGLTRDDGDAAD